jgi:hypothetical protein
MNQAECERRKQHIEGELEIAIEILRAGARAQVRALDMVWMASPENRAPSPLFLDSPLLPAVDRRLLAAPEPEEGDEPEAPPPPPPVRKRRGAAELYYEVFDLLEHLPETFDRTDFLPRLKPRPERSSLYRVLEELRREGWIEVAEIGRGTVPSTYRRKAKGPTERAEA